MQQNLLHKLFRYGILLLAVYSVEQSLRFSIGSFAIWSAFKMSMIWIMLRLWNKSYHPVQIITWMLVVIISCVSGVFIARDYWDYKELVNHSLNYSICLTALVVCTPDILQQVLSLLYKHIWKIFILLVLFLSSDGIAKFLVPFSFLALFYSLLDNRYRKYIWIAFLITVFLGYDGRSETIKFSFCIGLGYMVNRMDVLGYIRKLYWIFFILPFILFTLAATGTFNIFKIGEELNLSGNSRLNTIDTRTLLYEEVISTSLDRKTVLFGNTPARGYISEWMSKTDDQSEIMGEIHYGERGGTESSVLNVFMHFGILGMIVYLILFFSASFLAIFRSNSSYLPIVGCCLAFRYLMGWIEDFTNFDINMFFIWTMIGICYSPYFREMDDDDFVNWFNEIVP